jgi:predicted acetyltransferase
MTERLIKLYKECFPEDNDAIVRIMFEKSLGKKNALIEYDGEKIAAAMYLVDKVLYLYGKTYPLPYIVALGTAVDYRYTGYAEKLLNKSLNGLFDKGIPFVGLYPFKHSFYERYGFFTPSYDYEIEGEKAECDSSRAKALYEEFCRPIDCYIVRDEGYFDFLEEIGNAENTPFYEIVKDGKTVGYGHIDDCIPVRFYKGTEKGAMLRIVDAKRALEAARATIDKRIKITDPMIAKNNFCCKAVDGQVEITDGYDEEVDVKALGEMLFEKMQVYLADRY